MSDSNKIPDLNEPAHRRRLEYWATQAALYTVIAHGLVLQMACEKNFDIVVPYSEPQLVVEAYINNEIPEYNYVVLSKSQTVENANIENIGVRNALVKISEGSLIQNNTITWDSNSTVILKETKLPGLPLNSGNGFYSDPNLQANPSKALHGSSGKYYLLEIEVDGRYYSAITSILYPIPIDSLSTAYHYTDVDKTEKGRVTVHFKDPDTTGNCQLFYWRHNDNKENFGWGSLGTSKRIINSDETSNGDYMNITNSYGFVKGDSITYYMAHVTRSVYNFWNSYNKARNSIGPLSTPVSLLNNINGKNVTGCFSGLAISTASIVMD